MPITITDTRHLEGSLCVTAPAKVNLFLHVVGKRTDGYHLLETLVGFCDFGDEIEITKRSKTDPQMRPPTVHFSVSGPYAGALDGLPPENNLVLKAAQMLGQAADQDITSLHIHLKKTLPIAAGIGGGSADAAATLLGLNHWWGLDWPLSRLLPLAEHLGADVPMCLKSALSYVTGIGEEVYPLQNALSLPIVLVNPNIPLSTPQVFKARQGGFTDSLISQLGQAGPFGAMMPETMTMLCEALSKWHNDLEPPACDLEPAIGIILSKLSAQPGCQIARMSGSGATCFGLFESMAQASQAVHALRAEQPNWWVHAGALS